MRSRPTVLHVDLDAFFAAVEQRDKPSLRGKPVVVGGIGGRGVVATASYEARAFGVGSAMPTAEARRRCPNAAYLAGRFAAYRAASDVVLAVLREVTPLVEAVSLDEAYLDLGPLGDIDVATATDTAARLRARIRETTGLTASVGAGTSKLVAKIASDLRKPDALVVVPPGQEAATLAPLPVRRLPGIGPATEQRLRPLGLRRIGQLAALPERDLVDLLGAAHGSATWAASQGRDDRAVVPEREAKSVSVEETFAADVVDRRLLEAHVRRLAQRLGERLDAHGTSGRTVTLKLRRHDFTALTRSTTLPQPAGSVREITAAALALLEVVDVGGGARLLGVGVSGLTGFAQPRLFGDQDDDAPLRTTEVATAAAAPPAVVSWRPGQDVRHAELGPGWVQGSGLGRVTVRFEGPHTRPGPVRTFRQDDAALAGSDPPVWEPVR